MVVRRIRMLLEVWDRSTLADQEATIGRVKTQRRAARQEAASTTSSTSKRAKDGELVIATDAHIRLAAPST